MLNGYSHLFSHLKCATKAHTPHTYSTSLSLSLVFNAMDSYALDKTETVFPCGNCQLPIICEHQGLQCDMCNHFFHAPCQRLGDCLYDYLSNTNCSWHCTKCNSLNFSQASSQNLSCLTSNNRFNILNTTEQDFAPTSSPTPVKETRQKAQKSETPLKAALINFQSIREKKPQFYSFVETYKPDIIVGTKTWLSPDIFDSEYFPPELGYTVHRRDQIGQKGGRVIILAKSAHL